MTNPQITIPEALALAVKHHDAGEFGEADQYYARVLMADQSVADAWNLWGLLAHQNGRHDVACVFIQRAIALQPTVAYFHGSLGKVKLAMKRPQEAIGALEWASTLDPKDADTWNNLGVAYRDVDRLEDGIEAHQHALRVQADHAGALSNLSTAYHAARDTSRAIEYGRRAVAAKPDWADAKWNLALALLLDGQYEEGWKLKECRWETTAHNSPNYTFPMPRWNGESLAGKSLLIWGEQGMGDMIQMVRYIPRLRAQGATVHIVVDKLLKRLFEPLADSVTGMGEAVELPKCDYHLPMMSLPVATGIFEPFWDGAYIQSPDNVLMTIPCSENLKVGVCWAGNPNHHNDRHRSLTLDDMPLDVEGIAFYSLQKSDSPDAKRIIDLMPQCDDLADTAQIIANLDLVITVDTSVAHLAGAMGKPTWIILPNNADWRWLATGDTSAYYPSMRLFRGGRDAMGEVVEALKAEVTKSSQPELLPALSI